MVPSFCVDARFPRVLSGAELHEDVRYCMVHVGVSPIRPLVEGGRALPEEKSMTTTPLQDLESRSYSTYPARVEAARRLKSREHAWNASLVSLTVAVTIAAVALLVDPEVFGPRGEALMVCLSVLSLAAAIIVPSLNYSRRANDMSVNYRRIQQLSVDAER